MWQCVRCGIENEDSVARRHHQDSRRYRKRYLSRGSSNGSILGLIVIILFLLYMPVTSYIKYLSATQQVTQYHQDCRPAANRGDTNTTDQPCYDEPGKADFWSDQHYSRTGAVYHADLTVKNGNTYHAYSEVLAISYDPLPEHQKCMVEIWKGRATMVMVNKSPISTHENPVYLMESNLRTAKVLGIPAAIGATLLICVIVWATRRSS
jgi:hypothetical protein